MSDSKNIQTNEKPTGCIPALLRVFWMIGGALILVMCFFAIAVGKAPAVSSILFWFTVAAMVAVRFFDIVKFGGSTSEGIPATVSHGIKYSVRLVLVAAGMFVIAKLVSIFNLL